MEKDKDTVVLYDEDGNDIRFEFLDTIPHDGFQYIALCPFDEKGTDRGEVVLLQVVEDAETGEEYYAIIEDKALYRTVYEKFKAQNADAFSFRD